MNKVQEAIIEYISEFNDTLENPVDLSKGADSVLFGVDGTLDSVDFVSLVVDIEQMVEEKFGHLVDLTDSHAMSQKNSPFRTIGTLADYIEARLKEQSNG
ncbi:MAG: acyl carrier protein [Schwartzia sp.]|nr:acyl carrier protein [Schwartzia sp. (in: firmicutes)]